MQLKIILAESDNVTDRKLKILVCQGDFARKNIFFRSQRLFTFWWQLENNTLAPGCSRTKGKKLTCSGRESYKCIWLERQFAEIELSASVQIASQQKMHNKRIFTYFQSRFARTKQHVNCSLLLFCFRELNNFLKEVEVVVRIRQCYSYKSQSREKSDSLL